MGKIRLTKGELKRQRDALKQYERYLPTLQLKKQQLQMEILHQQGIFEEKRCAAAEKIEAAEVWAGLLTDKVEIRPFVIPKNIIKDYRNVAGVDLAVFKNAEFREEEYDLFATPMWVDGAIYFLRIINALREEIRIIEEGIRVLRNELRITTQRVNLFEKVKIPEAEEAIRVIKIYIGDQMANAVGRSKIAKSKIEEAKLEEVAV
jgi:V/A-type H+-transporting ATPase subunit D